MNTTTDSSLGLLLQRKQQERDARITAQARFAAAQYLEDNKKRRNRYALSVLMLLIGMMILVSDFANRVHHETSAKSLSAPHHFMKTGQQ
jgi:hypothetical protein